MALAATAILYVVKDFPHVVELRDTSVQFFWQNKGRELSTDQNHLSLKKKIACMPVWRQKWHFCQNHSVLC